jgi:peptidoglycan/LPS O-acetylase OafA/YrhL
MRLDQASDEDRGSNNFDLLRLLAAVLVLFSHSFDLIDKPEPFPSLGKNMNWGFVGLLVFFSISGFLVSRSWTRNPRVAPFVVKRALRLMPALIVALLLSALVLGPAVTTRTPESYFQDQGTKEYVLNNALLQTTYRLPGVFTHNAYPVAVNGSLWTLPLEVKAYVLVLLLGLIGLLTRRRWLMGVVAVIAVLACVDSVRNAVPEGNHLLASLVNIQADSELVAEAKLGAATIYADMFATFTIGAALFALRRWVTLRWELALGAVVAWCATLALGGSAPEVGAVVLAPYLVLFLAYGTHNLVRLPEWWGDYSYGTYIYGFPVQQTISFLALPATGWLMFGLSLPITMLLAVPSWHLIERPALEMKRRLTGSEPPAGVPGAESVAAVG